MDQNSLESGHQAKEIELFAHKRVWMQVKTSMEPISPPDIFLFRGLFFSPVRFIDGYVHRPTWSAPDGDMAVVRRLAARGR